ncbi:hypothetical protein ACZ98_23545 (plasmid) [Vibrio parahaemolyticus]|nr:hypothetical protein ACZ98_23545 [Vibrio parahaemolyticus]
MVIYGYKMVVASQNITKQQMQAYVLKGLNIKNGISTYALLVSQLMQTGISIYAFWYLNLCKRVSLFMHFGISTYA